MKNTVTPDNAPFTHLNRVLADMRANEARVQRMKLERLAWEAQRAMNDYLQALQEFEKHRNEDAGRRADAEIKAGNLPF